MTMVPAEVLLVLQPRRCCRLLPAIRSRAVPLQDRACEEGHTTSLHSHKHDSTEDAELHIDTRWCIVRLISQNGTDTF